MWSVGAAVHAHAHVGVCGCAWLGAPVSACTLYMYMHVFELERWQSVHSCLGILGDSKVWQGRP